METHLQRLKRKFSENEWQELLKRATENDRPTFLVHGKPLWPRSHPIRKAVEKWVDSRFHEFPEQLKRIVVTTLCEGRRIEEYEQEVWRVYSEHRQDLEKLRRRTRDRLEALCGTDPVTYKILADQVTVLGEWIDKVSKRIPYRHRDWHRTNKPIYTDPRSGPSKLSGPAELALRAQAAYEIVTAYLFWGGLSFDKARQLSREGLKVAGFSRRQEVDPDFFGPDVAVLERIAGRPFPPQVPRALNSERLQQIWPGGRPRRPSRGDHAPAANLIGLFESLFDAELKRKQDWRFDPSRPERLAERIERRFDGSVHLSRNKRRLLRERLADPRSTAHSLAVLCTSFVVRRTPESLRKIKPVKPGKTTRSNSGSRF